MLKVFRWVLGWAAFFNTAGYCAVVGETITVGADSVLPLNARYFKPPGPGPFAAILVLHGSGGLWKNDDPVGGVMSAHFEDWAQDLAKEGYASLFLDSYTARGIVEFASRRPAEDPAIDDAICSPSYERPKDVFKAFAYLQQRAEIIPNRIGLRGFSQGAEAALTSMLSPSVTPADWTMSVLKLDGTTETRLFPAPPRLGPGAVPGFAVAVVYYRGCGFFGYFGSPSSTAENLYMPYAPTLIQHGSDDPLYSANLYPEKFVLKSAAQALARSLAFNPLQIIVYPGATHSFDEAILGPDPAEDTANQAARRHARDTTLRWFEVFLKPPRLAVARQGDGKVQILWPRAQGVTYRLFSGSNPQDMSSIILNVQAVSTESGIPFELIATEPRQFFRLEASPPGIF